MAPFFIKYNFFIPRIKPVLSDIPLPDGKYSPDDRPVASADAGSGRYVRIVLRH